MGKRNKTIGHSLTDLWKAKKLLEEAEIKGGKDEIKEGMKSFEEGQKSTNKGKSRIVEPVKVDEAKAQENLEEVLNESRVCDYIETRTMNFSYRGIFVEDLIFEKARGKSVASLKGFSAKVAVEGEILLSKIRECLKKLQLKKENDNGQIKAEEIEGIFKVNGGNFSESEKNIINELIRRLREKKLEENRDL